MGVTRRILPSEWGRKWKRGGGHAEVEQRDGAAARMNLRGSRGAGLQERGRHTYCSNTQTAPDLAGGPFFFGALR